MVVGRLACALLFIAVTGLAQAAPEAEPWETRLASTLRALDNHKLDQAIHELDQILRENPRFRLAELLKGDLLMAYAGRMTGLGQVEAAPKEQLDELRSEAEMRLRRLLDDAPIKKLPRYLWKLSERQKYILVADAGQSRLYLYQNINGEPQYVADYYMTIGKLGLDKTVEGDQRTPLGVYHITSFTPKDQLADLYGSGAFPLNYPNEWDKRNGKTGHGIWIHGTQSDTYSRPPRSSNGCLVLSNDNLERLMPYLQVGITPVIVTPQIEWENENSLQDKQALLTTLEQWRSDWSSLDTERYLAHYSADFFNDETNYRGWVSQKRQVNAGKEWIDVELNDISVFAYPGVSGAMAIVEFEQHYKSNNLSDRMRKRQYWIKKSNQWQILYEGAT